VTGRIGLRDLVDDEIKCGLHGEWKSKAATKSRNEVRLSRPSGRRS
jgi:hypothetical protein